jgi:cyclopropane fatty-acyl-phospholipid synthase-like methyltransferase
MGKLEEAIEVFWTARAQSSDVRASRFHSKHTAFDLESIGAIVSSGSRILDLGCGRGEVAIALAQAGHHITAVDFMAKFLEHIPNDVNIETVVCDAREYLKIEKSFDAVLMLGLITSFPNADDRDTLYRNAHQMLRPEGTLFIKAQFGLREDVLVDKWSEDLGMHYTGMYPSKDDELARLGILFDVECVDPYPEEFNRYANTRMQYMIAHPKPQAV